MNSIISQLHSKKANIGYNPSSPAGIESLDLRVSSSVNESNGRKRRTASSNVEYVVSIPNLCLIIRLDVTA